MKRKVCVILPAFNEAANIKILLPRIFEQQNLLKDHELHVLVVDDSSPDGTADIVKKDQKIRPNLHLLVGEKKGLGEAYKRGMDYALHKLKTDIIIQMDADLQHDPAMINLFLTMNRFDFTLVIGSRFLPGASTVNFSLYRKMISLFGNFLLRFLGGLPRLRDLTTGYRCIEGSLIEKCELDKLSTRGYSFQTSLLFELLRNGAKVIEIPIIFSERIYGKSKLMLQDKVEFIVNLVKIRFGRFYEFIRYVIIGFSGLIVNMGLLYLLTRVCKLELTAAAIIAVEVSILNNFIVNNLWGFRGKNLSNVLKKMLNFHGSAMPGSLTNLSILFLFVYGLNFPDLIANLLGIGCGIIINYGVVAYLGWFKKEN